MLEVVQQAVEAARKAGAGYADARSVTEETESLSVRNQEVEGIAAISRLTRSVARHASHWLMLDAPQWFHEELVRFLGQCRPVN